MVVYYEVAFFFCMFFFLSDFDVFLRLKLFAEIFMYRLFIC